MYTKLLIISTIYEWKEYTVNLKVNEYYGTFKVVNIKTW